MIEYTKNCPKCGRLQKYKNNILLQSAILHNNQCIKCRGKESSIYLKGRFVGKQNHFYGKKHTEEALVKIRAGGAKGSKLRITTCNNFEIWKNKYGIEKATEKWNVLKKNLSVKMSGAGNPMYNKPSPQGSGNGWKGWYKGWFFRSLMELTYLINVIEKNNWKWKTAETKALSIPYINWDGKRRTYRADFFIENNLLIECKPKSLHNSPLVLIKKDAAEKFCKENNYTYRIEDVGILSKEEICQLYNDNKIKFTLKYDKMFNDKWNIKESNE